MEIILYSPETKEERSPVALFFLSQFYCAEGLSPYDAHALCTGGRRRGAVGTA